jgi:CheY-like chemotaxis protein
VSANRCVLIIDDDEDIRQILTEFLRFRGHQVLEARDGIEGFERLREGPRPDVILLDLMMPRMDGFEFHRRFSSDPDVAKIPVVVITASGKMVQDELGAYALLAKPFSMDDVLSLVASIPGTAPTE